jgi:copper chaperone CopZ
MKFTLSSSKQIFAMTLVWVAALFAIDYIKYPRPLSELFGMGQGRFGDAVRPTNPTITLRVNHLCCSGCLDDLRAALRPLTWVDKVELQKDSLTRQVSNQRERSLDDFSNRVQIEIKAEDITRVDFVALDRAVRDAGFFAEHIQFGGLPHMRLEAHVPHMCCNLCKVAVEEGVKIARQPGTGDDFKWLDSVKVDRPQKIIMAYTHYGSIVDVGEFIAALNHLGFPPAALTVSREN